MTANFPEELRFLFEPARYKVAWGGRGAAKSWNFGRALLLQGGQRPLRILCARETQKSIADSVHQLLKSQIIELGLDKFYEVEKASIYAKNGTEFIFSGLKHNVDNLKSIEACDICWVEEAQSVSKSSWETLIPTIRKENSEIWVSFNPDLETDETYRKFVTSPPPGAIVKRLTFRDNPWFPEVLRREMEHLRETDYDAYMHVWEGCCISVIEGAVYANELHELDKSQRITRVPYDPAFPVNTYWDLGYGDCTAIWFSQVVGFEYRLIDYLEDSKRPLEHYLKLLQNRGYLYGTDWLPHDAQARQLGSGKSIEELMRAAGRRVEIVPRLSIADGINAARTIFPVCWFDSERCQDGLTALRHYRYGEVATLGSPTREPLHDAASHGSDSFRYFALGCKRPKSLDWRKPKTGPLYREGSAGQGWMA